MVKLPPLLLETSYAIDSIPLVQARGLPHSDMFQVTFSAAIVGAATSNNAMPVARTVNGLLFSVNIGFPPSLFCFSADRSGSRNAQILPMTPTRPDRIPD